MIKLKSLITEWSSKRDPNKVDLKWIRHIQISTAEPRYIRTDHIVKTGKAMKKVDKKLAKEFDKLGSKYIKHQEFYYKLKSKHQISSVLCFKMHYIHFTNL